MRQITVTSPLLPPLGEYTRLLAEIWESRRVTNNGPFHARFERELEQFLGLPYLSLFTNGTLPLVTALQALNLQGEVITTPYSFVATTHALWWNGIRPVFADVDPVTGNLDPDAVEGMVTRHTTAILAVHVYGNPCDTVGLRRVADRYGLRLIYDAAHAFGVRRGGRSILSEGDLSTLSFHATKVFGTVEGGAVVCHDAAMKERLDKLRNFGFASETEVVAPGINSKMDELRAAFGLLNLQQFEHAVAARRRAAGVYRSALAGMPGLRMLGDFEGVTHNYSHFPVFIDPKEYGESRDRLYSRLREAGILARRYFYPLISDFNTYRSLPSAAPGLLPNARRLAASVICLPMHHLLSDEDLERVIEVVRIRN